MEKSRQLKYPYYFLTLALLVLPFIIMDQVFHLEYHPMGSPNSDAKSKTVRAPELIEEAPDKKLDTVRLTTDTTKLSDSSQLSDTPPLATSEEEESYPIEKNEFFSSLEERYQSALVAHKKSKKPRTDVVIRYYVHPSDGQKPYALRQVGYYIHERKADESLANYESNSILYGDEVKKEDVLLVAYTLLQEGMPIKKISLSVYHDSWKSRAIEIGADTSINDFPVLPLEELITLSKN